MFIDKATIKVQAGSGGNGAVSFHKMCIRDRHTGGRNVVR